MGWEKILKGKISTSDIKLVNYILRDGEFRTMDRIMDEIYDLIEENKKLGEGGRRRTPIQITTFGQSKSRMKGFMTNSPDYEVRDTGNKDHNYQPIKEYRYIGE